MQTIDPQHQASTRLDTSHDLSTVLDAIGVHPSVDFEQESARVSAMFRLATMKSQHPKLRRRLAEAQLDLAAAIIAMDDAADQPGRHNLAEQAAVEQASAAFTQVLADLLRGEA